MGRHRWRQGAAAALLAAVLYGVHAQPAPVHQVRPSADHVPANLLRISLEFAAPVEGGVLSRLALIDGGGSVIEGPFLPQELWSPDGRVLTVLLHPGRVKSGLRAHEALGPILRTGHTVTLTLDSHPLHRWRIDAADTAGPVVRAWRVAPVGAGTRHALVVTLDGAIDGRDADFIAVADADGRRLRGQAALGIGETRWAFTPAQPWRPGRYRLVVRGLMEDAAGNRVNGHFETAPGGVPAAADQVRSFIVEAPAGAAARRRRQDP